MRVQDGTTGANQLYPVRRPSFGKLRTSQVGINATTNSSSVELGRVLYRPWGETRASTGTTPTTWRFTGQREDATIGLYFYNARYLDPQPGRFVQPDTIVPEPSNPQSLNRYSYTLNNPIRYTDPSGHAQVCADGDEGGGCGAGANTAHIWQTFAGRRSPLLDYYAILHQLTQAQANRASAVELEALAGAADSAYAAGSAWLPQHQFDPAVVVEPASLVSIGGAITSGGMRAFRTAARGFASIGTTTPHPLLPPGGENPWSSSPVSVILPDQTTLYRVWGGGAGRVGAWLSPTRPPTISVARSALALPPSNSAEFVSEVVVPAGTRVQVGWVAPAFGQPGGALQVQLLDRIPIEQFGPGASLLP